MSSLNGHHSETLGFLLHAIARLKQKFDKMDQKMDQLMAEIGDMRNQQNARIMEDQPNGCSPMNTPSNVETPAEFCSVEDAVENNGEEEDDLGAATASSAGNFPISQEKLIMLKSKSSSTMNFSVHLLRELFTLEELEGKSILGSRSKDKVDPTRVEIIKELVFKVDNTEPSHKEMVWRSCRQAIDAYIRRMKR